MFEKQSSGRAPNRSLCSLQKLSYSRY